MADQRLVMFNADDFGLTEGVCRGIVEAISGGVVTTTTAMVCATGSAQRVTEWGQHLAGRIGIHLQLTDGEPCLDRASIPSIVTADGEFPRAMAGVVNVDLSHVRVEWWAQIDRLRSWGIEPSNLAATARLA